MDVAQVVKIKRIGGRFTHYSRDVILGVGGSSTAKDSKIFKITKGISSFLMDLSVATSCVSGKFAAYRDNNPIIVNNVLFPLALETTPLIIGEWLEDELRIEVENTEESERILQYMFTAIEITTSERDTIMEVLGALK